MLDIQNATDAEILEEVEKLQYLFRMKKVIRYHHDRTEEIDTESVAEHVYGMFIIAEYFLPHEDPKQLWNRQKIYKLMLYHDIDEIETGDTIGYLKTDAERVKGAEAARVAITRMPLQMQSEVSALLQEYDERRTPEARFAKAIDKMEPNFHLFCENGKKIHEHNKTTRDQHSRIKDPYIVDFPAMHRFNKVMVETMEAQGHFTKEE